MIRRRLTVLAVAALAIALAIVTAGFYVLLSLALERDASAVLQARLEAASAAVSVVDGRVTLADAPGDETLDATTWVLGPGGEVVLAPTTTQVPTREIVALAGVTRPTTRDLGEASRALAAPVPGIDPTTATVVVTLSLAPYETAEQVGLVGALVLDAVSLLLLSVLARWLVGSALRPMDRMTRTARDWAEHDIDRRFTVEGDDEIGRLGVTLNSLLSRVGASVRHERRLTDEIAHELRTPLARARMEAEVAVTSDDADELRAALRAVIEDVDELTATVNTLMDTARLGTLDEREADLVLVCTAAVAAATGGDENVIDVLLDSPNQPLLAAVDPAVIRRILGPQLENAVRHATSQVRLTVRRAGDHAEVEVADDGPGLGADELETVFRPGTRGQGSQGLGLGLALARRLARAAGGDVVAEPGPGGRFRTELPLAQDAT